MQRDSPLGAVGNTEAALGHIAVADLAVFVEQSVRPGDGIIALDLSAGGRAGQGDRQACRQPVLQARDGGRDGGWEGGGERVGPAGELSGTHGTRGAGGYMRAFCCAKARTTKPTAKHLVGL